MPRWPRANCPPSRSRGSHTSLSVGAEYEIIVLNNAEAAARQKPGTDYGALKSLVNTLTTRRRSNQDLSAEERTNLETYLRYKTVSPFERPQFLTPTFEVHRRGFIHLPALTGTAGKELDHNSMEGRLDEIEDVRVQDLVDVRLLGIARVCPVEE